jgi:hypothetical protein
VAPMKAIPASVLEDRSMKAKRKQGRMRHLTYLQTKAPASSAAHSPPPPSSAARWASVHRQAAASTTGGAAERATGPRIPPWGRCWAGYEPPPLSARALFTRTREQAPLRQLLGRAEHMDAARKYPASPPPRRFPERRVEGPHGVLVRQLSVYVLALFRRKRRSFLIG